MFFNILTFEIINLIEMATFLIKFTYLCRITSVILKKKNVIARNGFEFEI